jgi:amino acid transporter
MMQEADEVVSSFPSSEPISKSLVMPVLRKDGEANDDGTSQLGNIEVPDALPIDSELSSEGRAKIGMVPLAVMIFYSVSGGPFGCEASVRAGGNFYTLLGFLVMPFVWSMQEALITAELGTTFPEASGGVAWVEEAFGKNAGWMCGYLGWMAGATDNAIYPVLFLDYVLEVVQPNGEAMNPVLRFLLLSSISIGLGYVNWLGLPLVGQMSVAICCVAM